MSAPQMATARCARLRFSLTVYVCFLRVICVSFLNERLLIVVFIFVGGHAFCLSEAGSARGHLSAACKGISLVIGRTCISVGILSLI